MTYGIKRKPKVLKEKSSSHKSFSINAHNYSWSRDAKGIMEVSLGNMTDAGWYWNGDQNDLNGFLFRLNHSRVKDEFLEDVEKENVTFAEIKPQLSKSVNKDDGGFYELSGDNNIWKFGNDSFDVEDSSLFDEENLNEEQKNKVWNVYNSITYEEFEKKYSKSYKADMQKAIDESDSYEEFMERQDEIAEDLVNKRVDENQSRLMEAINEVNDKK